MRGEPQGQVSPSRLNLDVEPKWMPSYESLLRKRGGLKDSILTLQHLRDRSRLHMRRSADYPACPEIWGVLRSNFFLFFLPERSVPLRSITNGLQDLLISKVPRKIRNPDPNWVEKGGDTHKIIGGRNMESQSSWDVLDWTSVEAVTGSLLHSMDEFLLPAEDVIAETWESTLYSLYRMFCSSLYLLACNARHNCWTKWAWCSGLASDFVFHWSLVPTPKSKYPIVRGENAVVQGIV
eukprot:Gb_21806 [translate_table: standard]